jgi:hypothetical protein
LQPIAKTAKGPEITADILFELNKTEGIKMIKIKTAVNKLQKQFPGIDHIMDASEWGDYQDAIHLGNAAEGGEIDGLPAADYYLEFNSATYDHEFGFGVHIKLAKALDKLGFSTEWYDAGTLLAFRK